ncbi:MAG: DUF1566 domain-containing protein [archaeon]|jgi:hypothetical protein
MVMFSSKEFRAQGTIEYLVIIAVVVVISLVVVGILVGFLGTGSEVGEQSSQLSNWSNLIAITETSVDPDGNYLVRLANNSSDPITIANVQVGDTNVNFSEDLFMGGAQNFVIPSGESCVEGENATRQVKVTYYSKYGVQKTEIYPASTFFDCESYSVNLLASRCEVCSSATYVGDAVVGEVKTGSTFYSNSSTLLTGTGTKYLSVGSTTVTAGYYDTNDLATIDTDLIAGNIVTGTTIFGVAGSATEQGATQYMLNSTPSFSAGYYDANDLNVIDIDLVASNILDTATIFGITGTASAGGGVELHSGQTTSYGTAPDDADKDGTAKSYTDNGDGTVTDNHTGLVWMKNHKDNCATLTLESALSYCSTLASGSGGLTDGSVAGDWRVPSFVELATLPDMSYPSSSYLNSVFTQTGWNSTCSGYWSSTTVPSNTSFAYYLYSGGGYIGFDGKTSGSHLGVRCVRSE